MKLLEALIDSPLCTDGDIGELLRARGHGSGISVEELCVAQPELVADAHAEFLAAGAHVIRTNSRRAGLAELSARGLADHANEINWQAAQIAVQSARGTGVPVGGVVGPLGPSAAEQGLDREKSFRLQIGALLDGGVNFISLERFRDLDEILLALEVKHSLHHCPVICTLDVRAGAFTAGRAGEALRTLADQGADLCGLSLASEDREVSLLPFHTGAADDFTLAAFFDEDSSGGTLALPDGAATASALERGTRLIGGGCYPIYTATLARQLRELAVLPEAAHSL